MAGDGDSSAEHRAIRGEPDAIGMLIEEQRAARKEMRAGFAAIQERLAKGDTAIALIEERQSNQGAFIASLIKRFDELERMTRALACDDCEDRIEKLEQWTEARDTLAADADKRRTWQPPWWLMLLATALFGVLTAILTKRLGV